MKMRFKQIIATAFVAGVMGTNSLMGTPTSLTGTYTNNFNSLGTTTAMPAGFRTMSISGANSTYTAANPISTTAVASATASGTQTLTVWNFGSAVASSGTTLFNAGTYGNNTDRALGSDPTGNGAMVIELSLSNNTGGSLAGVTFAYDAKCMTNGSAGTEASELPGYSFFYSLTGSTAAADWTKVSALSLTNYTQGTAQSSGNVTISFPSPLTNNGVMYFRWADDNNQSSSPDQMIAVDNVGVTAISATGPFVTITSPTNNSSYLSGSTISLTATTSDSTGTITNVSFYYNATNKLTDLTVAPYTYSFESVPAGNYALTAVASDNGGLSRTSAVVNVIVTNLSPSVSITAPANNTKYTSGTNLLITANATENGGSVTNVAFYYNATNLLVNLPSAPYSLTWSNVPAGAYALSAIATDFAGTAVTSSVVNITVTNLSPIVSITSPTNNSKYAPGSNIAITATASEVGGSVTNIELYYNATNLLGSSTTSPVSLTWSNVDVGTYSLTAIATDYAGISKTSSVISVTVAHVSPTVVLTAPVTGAAYGAPASIGFSATPTFTDGAITNVAFYQGSTKIADVPSAPYNYIWGGVLAGSYSITARASDVYGLTATSAVATVTVTNPAVASFTGNYYQDFDLALSNSTTAMPAGFKAFGLASDHLTFTNGIPITSNSIASPTAGVAALTVWNFGTAVAKAGSTLFNVGGFTNLNDRSLGTDSTGNGATVIQLAISNNTGGLLPGVIFSYTEKCLTNGSTSNGSFTNDGTERLELPGYSFFYSTVGDSNPSNWFYVEALSLTNWVQGTVSNSGNVSITFATPLANNGIMYFRWADDNCVASSPDQMFAIDNISITPSVVTNQFYAGYYSGLGFISGFNMIFTNTAGSNFYTWSSTNPLAPASTWALEGLMAEQHLNDGSGLSRYSITLNPTVSPTYYLIGATNSGPYAPAAPVQWATVENGDDYTFYANTYAMNAAGVLQVPQPLVAVTSPTNGTVFTTGSSPVLTADASDTNASIVSVAFYANAVLIDSTTNSPYSVTWTNPADGNYVLTAVVLDSLGVSATSSNINVIVGIPNVPPTISITSPTNNAAFLAPATIPLSVSTADSDGTVTNVAYYQGFSLLANVANAPFDYSWSGVSAGSYSVFAVATDNKGASTTSSVVTITVTNAFVASPLSQVKTVFVIAMENHNWNQVYGNSAAPYINSLVTPGNTNAAQVSFATQYYNAGNGVHPSEPNYVWAEAGTDFGVHTDADPGAGNTFTAPHLTAQLNTAGIPWKNYQEDVQYSSGPTHSVSGSGSVNVYNGSTSVDYAVKHNPMAFFTDTQNQNVSPLTNLIADLASNNVGRYNWITPDQLNDMHSSLSSFSYHGTTYTGDQAAIAEGDNFASILIPQIMASAAYQSNGVIIIWWDESEGGDTTSQAIGEIVISPLAKGNAYNSTLVYSHSSDVKTMEEIFGLPFLSNSIPAGETAATGGYNNVATVNDLSDMFVGLPSIGVQQPPGSYLSNGSVIAFGNVAVGTNAVKSFTIANTGSSSLTVSGIALSGLNSTDFAVGGISLPTTVAAGGGTNFSVTFTPAEGGARVASLQITNSVSGQSPFSVNLTGQGTLVTPSGLVVKPAGTSGFTLSFSVGANQPYRVLASTDAAAPLNTWTQIAFGNAVTNPVVFLDTNTLGSRFYKVVSP